MATELDGLLRRASYIVEDANAAASFYEQLFGWTRFYDNETAVDYRFPPSQPDGTIARIVILKAEDPFIGMIGFLQYLGSTPDEGVDRGRTELKMGDTVNVVEVKDIEACHARAVALGAKVLTAPVDWSVTDYSGTGTINLATFSFFDGNGIYFEVNTRRN